MQVFPPPRVGMPATGARAGSASGAGAASVSVLANAPGSGHAEAPFRSGFTRAFGRTPPSRAGARSRCRAPSLARFVVYARSAEVRPDAAHVTILRCCIDRRRHADETMRIESIPSFPGRNGGRPSCPRGTDTGRASAASRSNPPLRDASRSARRSRGTAPRIAACPSDASAATETPVRHPPDAERTRLFRARKPAPAAPSGVAGVRRPGRADKAEIPWISPFFVQPVAERRTARCGRPA